MIGLRKPVFDPRVCRVAVASFFPVTEFVLGEEFEFLDELGALPCVEFGNDHTRWAAMIGGNRFSLELGREEDITVVEDVERRVGGVSVVGGLEHKIGIGGRFDEIEKIGEGDT